MCQNVQHQPNNVLQLDFVPIYERILVDEMVLTEFLVHFYQAMLSIDDVVLDESHHHLKKKTLNSIPSKSYFYSK